MTIRRHSGRQELGRSLNVRKQEGRPIEAAYRSNCLLTNVAECFQGAGAQPVGIALAGLDQCAINQAAVE